MSRRVLSLFAALVVLPRLAAAQTFDHLECYKIKDPIARAAYTADLTPEQTQFLAQTGCTIKLPAKTFCIDVERSNISPAPPLAISGQNTRDYLCYRLKCPKDDFALPVEDAFGTRTVQVKRPSQICAPARKVGYPDPPTQTPCQAPPTPTPLPSCNDMIQNGSESDVDCGAPMCPLCANGQSCFSNSNCQSNLCQLGQCVSCIPSGPEQCNNIDDNCNGFTDEGLGSTTCGTGACQNTVQNCVAGMMQSCTPGSSSPETCNNVDDNCNGMVDDGVPNVGSPCDGADSDLCLEGTYTCNAGVPGCTDTTGSTFESCNNVDDNCDGNVDEGLGTNSCGTGACQNTVPNCVAGMPNNCTPLPSNPESCNNIDDNCNGSVDEGGAGCPSPQNAFATCNGVACGFACQVGYADCDAFAGNGCEINTQTDPAHCGGCNLFCSGTCTGGTCTP